MNSPVQVGITGGIGSGKTTVCGVFKLLGVPVYNSDLQARKLMEESDELVQKVKELFGSEALTPEGKPNRKVIAQLAFHNPALLQQLNSAVHPVVAIDYLNWQKKQESPYTLKEAALLIETGSYQGLDALIVVSAPQDLRLQRVLARDPHRLASDVKAIMNHQVSEKIRREKADFIIENDETQSVIQQVLHIHETILRKLG